MPTLGDKIREARTQHGLTQSELADQLVTPSMISQIESNRAQPSYHLLRGIAQRLGLDVSYFLTDVEDRHILTSQLKIAEYYILVGDISAALESLEIVERPSVPGENLHLYLRLMATVRRHTGNLIEAVHLMEELRENAYRTQDTILLIQVHQESGYIEYAMKNWKGAMMEWRNAVRLGEELLKTPLTPRVELAWELTDTYLAMADLATEQDDLASAAHWLADAQRLCISTRNLKGVSDSYIVDANRLLDENMPTTARILAERALAIIGAARQVKRQIVIGVKSNASTTEQDEKSNSLKDDDAWTYSAIHTSGTDPKAFLDAEILRIESLIAQAALEDALGRIVQGKFLLTSYVEQSRTCPTWHDLYITKFDICTADWKRASGDLKGAVECLEQIVNNGEETTALQSRALFSKLMAWYAEMGDIDNIMKLTERLQSWLETVPATANESAEA